MTNERPCLTVPEVAELFDISVDGLYRLVRENKVPYFKVGRSVRFSKDSIKKFIDGELKV
jgi:excisionase family DNA binding protein